MTESSWPVHHPFFFDTNLDFVMASALSDTTLARTFKADSTEGHTKVIETVLDVAHNNPVTMRRAGEGYQVDLDTLNRLAIKALLSIYDSGGAQEQGAEDTREDRKYPHQIDTTETPMAIRVRAAIAANAEEAPELTRLKRLLAVDSTSDRYRFRT